MSSLAAERAWLARVLPDPIWAAIADIVGDRRPAGATALQVPGTRLFVPVVELGTAATWRIGDTPVTVGVLEALLWAEP